MNEYLYDELENGTVEQFQVIITPLMMETFKQLTGDNNPLHCDEVFAKLVINSENTGGGVFVYGLLTASFLSTLAGVYLPGKYCLIHEVNVGFTKPVFIGDTLTVCGKVIQKNDLFKQIVLKVWITNQKGQKVLRGTMKTGVIK